MFQQWTNKPKSGTKVKNKSAKINNQINGIHKSLINKRAN